MRLCPGAIVLNATFGATSEEWKSIECGIFTSIAFEPPLTSVISTWSPWVTTIGAETPVPRYVLPFTAYDHTRVGASVFDTLVTCS